MASAAPTHTPAQIRDDNRGPALIAVNMTLAALATIAVILRFWSRKVARARILWDDYLIAVALVLALGLCFSMFVAVDTCGLGRHGEVKGMAGLVCFLKYLFAWDLVFNICTPIVKYSILCFYLRLFTPVRGLRIAVYCTGFYVAAWQIWNVISGILICNPPAKSWDSTIPGKCQDTIKIVIISSALNVSADVIILCIPMWSLWQLQMSRRDKIAVTAIFALGGFICIASVIRLIYITQALNFDITWEWSIGMMWSSVEPTLGIVSACLPTLAPLVRHVSESVSGSIGSRTKGSSKNSGTGKTGSGHGDAMYNSKGEGSTSSTTRVAANNSSDGEYNDSNQEKTEWEQLPLRNDTNKTARLTNNISRVSSRDKDDEVTDKQEAGAKKVDDVEAPNRSKDGIQVGHNIAWSEEKA